MFTNAVVTCFKKFFVLKGRASRKEFWYFFILVAIIHVFGFFMSLDFYLNNGTIASWLSLLFGLINIVIFFPYIAVSCRRLHDIGKSAGWIFILLIPVVGAIFYIVWMALPPVGKNKYGNIAKLK